jgi:hypothetical protein
MYEDAIDSILGDLQPGYTPGAARVNALRGNEPGSFATGAGGMPGGPSPMGPVTPPPQQQQPPQPPMPPGPPRTALPQAMAARPGATPPAPIGVPGGPSSPVPVPQGPGDPLATDYANIQQREQEAMAEQQRLMQPPDRSAMEQMYKRQSDAGANKLTLALAAQQAGPGYEPFQAQALKQYAASQEPLKTVGGTMTDQGFMEDPAYGQELKLKQIEARITALQKAREGNLTLQEHRRLGLLQEQEKARHDETLRAIAVTRAEGGANAAGTWTPVGTDPTTQAPVFHNGKTNQLSTIDAQGQQVPYAAGAYGPKLSAGGAGNKGGQVDPQHLIDLVGEARGYLKDATGSGLGAKVDQAANFFGASTKGAEATAKLDTVGGALVMAQPRMEGPQSDKDVALYKAMAGNVADNKLPIQQRAAALDAIEQLARKYQTGEFANPNRRVQGGPIPGAGGAPPGGAPQPGAPVRVNSALEASRLPSGTPFITPDGQRRVRQ